MNQPEMTPVQHHIQQLVAAYSNKTANSKALASQAKARLADKSSIGFSFTPETKEICYPVAVSKAQGAYLWDVDGNQYTDILMGLGTHLFGHNPDFIRNALGEQIDNGFAIGPQSPIAGEVAALVCQLTGMDRVTFSNTGTEAVMTAIRIARAATKRSKIAIFTNSYHGHADPVLVRAPIAEYARKKFRDRFSQQRFLKSAGQLLDSGMATQAVPAFPGVSAASAKDVMVLEYDNPKSLEIIAKYAHELAAVLVEPVQSRCTELQPKAFLQQLRDVSENKDIVLIFDEMVTGFRVAPGGAQQYFGIQADLATYSKITGGGLPLSVIAGKARYMDYIDGGEWHFGDASSPQVPTTFFAGTFSKHPLSLVSAKAALQYIIQEGDALYSQLNERTLALVTSLNKFTEKQGIPIRFVNFGSFFTVAESLSQLTPQAQLIFSYNLLLRGIHLRTGDKGGFLSTAHNASDIDFIFNAIAESLSEMASVGLIERI